MNSETKVAEINETLSMITTFFQSETNSIQEKKSILTIKIMTKEGAKIGGICSLNLNEFLPKTNQSLNTIQKGQKHTNEAVLPLQKCPDQNAFIKIKVTSSFLSEVFDFNDNLSIGSCGSRMSLATENDYLIDPTTNNANLPASISLSNLKVREDNHNNITFSFNNPKTEKSNSLGHFGQLNHVGKIATKEQIEEQIRNKKRLSQLSSPGESNLNSINSSLRKERSTVQNLYEGASSQPKGGEEIEKLKYENEKLKNDLFRAKFHHDHEQLQQVLDIQAENEQLKKTNKKIEEEKLVLIKDSSESKKQIEELNQKIALYEIRQKEVTEQLERNKQANLSIVTQFETLKTQVGDEINEKNQMINFLQKQQTAISVENEQLQTQQIEKLKRLEDTTTRLQSVVQQNSELRKVKDDMKSEIDRIKNERQAEKEKFNELLTISTQQIEELTENHRKTTQFNEQQIQLYNEEKSKNLKLIQVLQDQLKEFSSKLNEKQNSVGESERQVSTLMVELEGIRSADALKSEEIISLKKSLQDIRCRISEQISKSESEKTHELQKKDELLKSCQSQIEALHKNYEELETTFKNRQAKFEEQKGLMEIATVAKNQKIHAQGERIATLEDEFEKQRQILQAVLVDLENARNEQEVLRIKNLNLESDTSRQILLFKKQLAEHEVAAEKAKKSIEKLQKINDKLDEENTQLNFKMMNDLDSLVKKQNLYSTECAKFMNDRQKLNSSIS